MLFHIQHGLFKLDLTDYYAVLGIPLGADPKQIRKRYLNIARQLHPDTCTSREDTGGKEEANRILSRLVNPAYEVLSKDKSRKEFNLVLSQMGQRLAGQGGKITIASESAKDLFKANSNLDVVYKQKVKDLAVKQYQCWETNVLGYTIAQISELNLVYLILNQKQQAPAPAKDHPPKATTPKETTPKDSSPPPPKDPTDPVVRRAQQYLQQGNLTKAILDLREAVKVNPNNSSYHGLLGLTYLKQKQVGMAKVHINKAYASNPQDSFAMEGKQELSKISTAAQGTKTSTGSTSKDRASKTSKRGSLFKGLFGGKKK